MAGIKGKPVDQAKYDRVLEVAVKIFVEQGYQCCSIEHVAREAKVSKVTIYNRFGGKEGLFQKVIDSISEKISKTWNRPIQVSKSLREMVEEDALLALQILDSDLLLAFDKLFSREVPDYQRIGKHLLAAGPYRIRSILSERYEQYNASRLTEIADRELAAEQFVMMCVGFGALETKLGCSPSKEERLRRSHAAVSTFLTVHAVAVT